MDAPHQARCNGLAAGDPAGAAARIPRAPGRVLDGADEGIGRCAGAGTSPFRCKGGLLRPGDGSAEMFGLDGPLDHWREVCAAIRADVFRRGFDHELGSFVQSYGSKQLDASLLLLPLVGFLPPEDPRVRGTVQAIEQRLMVDGFVKRSTCRHR
jgi:hypothetical protein